MPEIECFWAEELPNLSENLDNEGHPLWNIGNRGPACKASDLPVGAVRKILLGPDTENNPPQWKVGPDGLCLAVETPAGLWIMDHQSSQGGFWYRNALDPNIKPGDKVNLTVLPSIRIHANKEYHAILQNGKLIEV